MQSWQQSGMRTQNFCPVLHLLSSYSPLPHCTPGRSRGHPILLTGQSWPHLRPWHLLFHPSSPSMVLWSQSEKHHFNYYLLPGLSWWSNTHCLSHHLFNFLLQNLWLSEVVFSADGLFHLPGAVPVSAVFPGSRMMFATTKDSVNIAECIKNVNESF